MSDRNSDGNSRILLPLFCLLLGNILPISQWIIFSQNSCQLKQMTAEFSNNSDRNSRQESRWLSYDVYFSDSSVDFDGEATGTSLDVQY